MTFCTKGFDGMLSTCTDITWTKGLYENVCCTATERSKLRSNNTNRGLERDATKLEDDSLKRLFLDFSASLIFASRAAAMCSAAPPFGHRITGTAPNVKNTENNPSTTFDTDACSRNIKKEVNASKCQYYILDCQPPCIDCQASCAHVIWQLISLNHPIECSASKTWLCTNHTFQYPALP